MQKLMRMFEDIWVAIAFAEAGEYALLGIRDQQLHSTKSARIRSLADAECRRPRC